MNAPHRCLVPRHLPRWVAPVLCLLAPAVAVANQGLVPQAGEWVWPQVQARITLQTAALAQGGLFATGGLGRLADPAAAQRGVQGGAVLGDYVFASPAFGNFRATSGVLLGAQGGVPTGQGASSARLSVSVLEGSAPANGEGPATMPYLGLGYSTPAVWRSFYLSADLGVVAGRPAGIAGLGRAVLGSQAKDAAMRDLRLAPMLQLGMRYSF